MIDLTLEMAFLNAVVMAQLLKLAGGATRTGQASLVVVGKDKLKVELSCLDDLGGVGKDRHTVGARIHASGYHAVGSAALGDLNQAKAASADGVDVLQIAQRGNLDFCGSCCLKDSTAFFHGVIHAVNFNGNSFHLCSPLS